MIDLVEEMFSWEARCLETLLELLRSDDCELRDKLLRVLLTLWDRLLFELLRLNLLLLELLDDRLRSLEPLLLFLLCFL